MKQPRLAHLDMVLYKWFTAMFSESKHVTGPMTNGGGGGGSLFLYNASTATQEKITCKHLGRTLNIMYFSHHQQI